MSRFTSRKFLMTLSANLIIFLVALFPDYRDLIEGWGEVVIKGIGLAGMGLVTMQYNHTEGKIDAARETQIIVETETTIDA